MYLYDQRPSTHFTGDSQAALQAIRESEYSVLVGRREIVKSCVWSLGQAAAFS